MIGTQLGKLKVHSGKFSRQEHVDEVPVDPVVPAAPCWGFFAT
ncbi:MAG: hypothetical protein WBD20_26980 [Pirellulaceae bacterium]